MPTAEVRITYIHDGSRFEGPMISYRNIGNHVILL